MNSPQKILLIFDLDETLIHATTKKLEAEPDFIIGDFFIYKRPFVDEFLQACFLKYKVALWSSADDEYVKETVKQLIPNHEYLEFIWARSNCSVKVVKKPIYDEGEFLGNYKEYQWIKPLNRIRRKGLRISSMLIIDNSPYKVIESKENALIIKSFYGDKKDRELTVLLKELEKYDTTLDVRKIDKNEYECR